MTNPPLARTDNAPAEDVLERAVCAIQEAGVPPGPPANLIETTLAAMSAPLPPHTKPTSFFTRKLLMRSLLATASVAAMAFVAVFLSIEFTPNSYAYADAVKQLRSARTLVYTSLIYTEGNPEPIKVKCYVAADGRQRHEMGSANVSIMDENHQLRLMLSVDSKTAFVTKPDEPSIVDETSPRFSTRDWIEQLASLGDKPDKELGIRLLDGQSVIGFEASQGIHKFTIWLDAHSKQLVRIESAFPKKSSIVKTAMTDFEFDKPLDDALFSFEIPSGYEVTKLDVSLPMVPGEQNVLEVLRGFSTDTEGEFPKDIMDWNEFAPVTTKGFVDGKLSDEGTKLAGHLGAIVPFLSGMSRDDYCYLGEGKTTKDADVIIFWYKNPEGKYRAIYGDLSIKEVSQESLPPRATTSNTSSKGPSTQEIPAGISPPESKVE